jgi:hypothetical protein
MKEAEREQKQRNIGRQAPQSNADRKLRHEMEMEGIKNCNLQQNWKQIRETAFHE